MAYVAMCNKYGILKVAGVAAGVPILGELGAKAVDLQVDGDKLFMLGSSGACGYAAGAVCELFVKIVLRKNKVGVARGSRILRRFQAAAYAVPVVGALALQPNAHDVVLPDGHVRHVTDSEYRDCFIKARAQNLTNRESQKRCYAP